MSSFRFWLMQIHARIRCFTGSEERFRRANLKAGVKPVVEISANAALIPPRLAPWITCVPDKGLVTAAKVEGFRGNRK